MLCRSVSLRWGREQPYPIVATFSPFASLFVFSDLLIKGKSAIPNSKYKPLREEANGRLRDSDFLVPNNSRQNAVGRNCARSRRKPRLVACRRGKGWTSAWTVGL